MKRSVFIILLASLLLKTFPTVAQNIEDVRRDNNKFIYSNSIKLFPGDSIKIQPGNIETKLTNFKLMDSIKDSSSTIKIYFTFDKFGMQNASQLKVSNPFLKQLVSDYKDKDFELVSIEIWSDNIAGIKRYCTNNGLNYKFLMSTKDVTKSYQTQSVPTFFILDKSRVIRKIINGYSEGITDKEIKDAINKLI